jgi:hypothetical protein
VDWSTQAACFQFQALVHDGKTLSAPPRSGRPWKAHSPPPSAAPRIAVVKNLLWSILCLAALPRSSERATERPVSEDFGLQSWVVQFLAAFRSRKQGKEAEKGGQTSQQSEACGHQLRSDLGRRQSFTAAAAAAASHINNSQHFL